MPPNRLVVALVYEGLRSLEFGSAAEVFGRAPEAVSSWYRFAACAIEPGPLSTVGELLVQAPAGAALLAEAGTIVIPGWKGPESEPRRELLDLLRAAHARGARIVALGTGVFVLAATGLLDGRPAACHWADVGALSSRHPKIRLQAQALYVDAGQLLTAAGGAAGLDVCLHLVRRDFGPGVAGKLAQRLLVDPHRVGGQAPFSVWPVSPLADARLSALLTEMAAHLDRPWLVADAAAAAGMSERTFLRRFREATGLTPADWLIAARVDRARQALESSRCSIEEVARVSGFGAVTSLRRHFQRRLGVSPAAYRRKFLRRPAA